MSNCVIGRSGPVVPDGSSAVCRGGNRRAVLWVQVLGVIAQRCGDGGEGAGEGATLGGGEVVEDQPSHRGDVGRGDRAQPLKASLGEASVLGPLVVRVLGDLHVTSINENPEPVGEAALGEVRRVGQVGQSERVFGGAREAHEDVVVNGEHVVIRAEVALDLGKRPLNDRKQAVPGLALVGVEPWG